jgi:hypothetical protein
MRRQLTAFVAALSLALASLPATQAEARSKKSDDTLAIVLGVAALGLLLSQVNNSNAAPVVTRNIGQKYNSGQKYSDDDWHDRGNKNWQDRGNRKKQRSRAIPAQCLVDVAVGGRWREVVSARCVDNMGLNRRLPQECIFKVRTSRGLRQVYGQRCLRDYGVRFEGQRY